MTNPYYSPGGSLSNPGGGSAGGAATGGPSDVNSVAAKVAPALVDINVTFGYQQASGAGTGIVLTSKGEILTNNHVIEGATAISVTDIGNGMTYSASVVGYDASADVAVLQLDGASNLQTARISSSSIGVGDAVVAIGNAGGTGGTPTASGGSVVALNQAITAGDDLTGTSESLVGLIETNADVQPGDSGGSLVNAAGEVVGMDTAASQAYSLSSQSSQGYAIPISEATSIASQIESGRGTSTVHVGPTAFLGVLISSSGSGSGYGTFDPFGGQYGYGSAQSGVEVSGVATGSPAQQAGLSQGDVIMAVGGATVSSPSDLNSQIDGHRPGDKVQVTWSDTSGQTHTATVTLGSGPAR